MTVFSGVFARDIKIWSWSAAMLAAIFQPYEKIMFMAFADANNNLLTGPQMNKQNSLLPTNKLSFCCRVETASPIKNTLSEQIPASEFCLPALAPRQSPPTAHSTIQQHNEFKVPVYPG